MGLAGLAGPASPASQASGAVGLTSCSLAARPARRIARYQEPARTSEEFLGIPMDSWEVIVVLLHSYEFIRIHSNS